MFNLYQKTVLEKWIENLYKKHNIHSPEALEIENISNEFNIHIEYLEGAAEVAIWSEDKTIIFLDPTKPKVIMREIFFHELCHPLRHFGNQFNVNDRFRELQEIQANQFQLYASMPFYMINKLSIKKYEIDMIHQLQETFDVPFNLAKKRFDQIKRRVLQQEIDQVVIKEYQQVYNIYENDPDRQKWKDVANEFAQLAISRKKQKEKVKNV